MKTVIQGYADENKDALITDDKRSLDLPLAVIGYRKWRNGASYSDLSQELGIKERWIRAIITIMLKQRNTNT